MRLHLVYVIGTGLLVSITSLWGQIGPQYRGMRSEAMGRTGIASAEGEQALFLNPAGLAGARVFARGGFGGTQGLNPVLLDYATWATKNAKYLTNVDSLVLRLDEIDSKWAPFAQHFQAAGQHNDIAFAVVNDLFYELTVAQGALTPIFGAAARSDLLLTMGRGMKLENGYSAGLALKYLYRVDYSRRLLGTTNPDFYRVKETLEEDADTFLEKVGKVKVAQEIARTQHGLGMNAGVRKQLDANWSLGAALLDFPTVIDGLVAKPSVNLGVGFQKGFQLHPEMTHRVVANLEWHHFLFFNEAWFHWFKAGVGAEAMVNRRQVAFVGMGFNDGYPTFGVRAGFIAYLGYTYFVREQGVEPGQDKLSFHKLTFELEI